MPDLAAYLAHGPMDGDLAPLPGPAVLELDDPVDQAAPDVQERLTLTLAPAYGMECSALRFFNVYGPGQHTDAYYTAVASIFLGRLLAGEPPIVDGSGEQTMDLVHVRDVARALVCAIESPSSGNVCNVGTATQTSVAELARLLIELVGTDLEPEFRPRAVLVARREADIRRAAETIGWKPEIGVREGMEEIVRLARDARP